MNASQALISRRGSLMSAAQVGGLRKHPFGRVDQLEDRYLGMVEAPSSNLGTSTSSLHIDGSEVNVRHGFRRYNEVKPLAWHVHQKRFSSGLLDVCHDFFNCDTVKPLAWHVHQKRFHTDVLRDVHDPSCSVGPTGKRHDCTRG